MRKRAVVPCVNTEHQSIGQRGRCNDSESNRFGRDDVQAAHREYPDWRLQRGSASESVVL